MPTLLVVTDGGAVGELDVDRVEFIGTRPVDHVHNRAPLRVDQSDIEGSLKDILGGGVATMKSESNGAAGKRRLGRGRQQPAVISEPTPRDQPHQSG